MLGAEGDANRVVDRQNEFFISLAPWIWKTIYKSQFENRWCYVEDKEELLDLQYLTTAMLTGAVHVTTLYILSVCLWWMKNRQSPRDQWCRGWWVHHSYVPRWEILYMTPTSIWEMWVHLFEGTWQLGTFTCGKMCWSILAVEKFGKKSHAAHESCALL